MKKSTYLIALALGASTITFAQNVGINTDGTDPDSDAILHINNHSGSSLDSSIIRIENEQNGANDVTGVEIYNSGTGATAKWDIYNPASGSTDLRIKGNGSDHVTIQNDGDVGIGTSSPNSDLHVYNSLHGNMKIQGGGLNLSAYLDIQNTARSQTLGQDGGYFRIQSDGGSTYNGYLRFFKMAIDGSSVLSEPMRMDANYVRTKHCIPQLDNTYDLGHPSFRWDDVYATNGTIQTSDRRLKTNIDSLEYGLAEVMQLTPVSFNWKSDSAQTRNKIGYIAQEVQKIIPEVVDVGDDENQTLGMNYSEMVVVLTNAIKEQQAIIEAQKKEIETQKAELGAQEKEVEEVKADASTNAEEIEALKAQVQQLLQLIQQQESALVTD